VRRSVSPAEIKTQPRQPEPKDLRIETAALVIAGGDNGTIGKATESSIHFFRRHLSNGDINGVGEMPQLEIIWIAHIDKCRRFVSHQRRYVRRVEQDIRIGIGGKGPEDTCRFGLAAGNLPALGEPLLVSADDKVARNTLCRELVAGFGTSVPREAQQNIGLASQVEVVLHRRKVCVAYMIEGRQHPALALFRFAQIYEIDPVRACFRRIVEKTRKFVGRNTLRVAHLTAVRQGLQRYIANGFARLDRRAHKICFQPPILFVLGAGPLEDVGGNGAQKEHNQAAKYPYRHSGPAVSALEAPAGAAIANQRAADHHGGQADHLGCAGEEIDREVG
jgi:hypothetical protein